MKQDIKHIIIKHLKGSKANQIEEFDYQANDSISFGRASGNELQFDSEQDNAVSREHGAITKGNTPGSFVITDNGSLNGTYVNDQKISGTYPLKPGDTISLGAKGPSFQFNVNPPLADSAATQLMELPNMDATMEIPLGEEAAITPTKAGIGKDTFERAIVTERKKSQKTLFSVVGAVLLLLLTLGYTFRSNIFPEKEVVIQKDSVIVRTLTETNIGMDAAKIARENGRKVVFIEFGYRLIHAPTGDDVYHQYTLETNEQTGQEYQVPLFIEVEPGVVEPLLGLKKDTELGVPIAVSQLSGSGFIVDPRGYVMTNKHIAEPWKYPYVFPPNASQGQLLQLVGGEWTVTGTVRAPANWIPSESKTFGREPVSGKNITGERTYLTVTFPKTDGRIEARFVQSSPNHDVAMLKIDHTANMTPVTMKENGDEVEQGERIAVMGYPGISPTVVYGRATNDVFRASGDVKIVPDPTITDGTIGKVIRGSNLSNRAELSGYYSMGDYYQLTASETGAGNSGGPVFDKNGEVVAIFAASLTSAEGARITFAIPIKYGLDLMHLTPVIQ
ncbi:MAG: trypsin-like peptidase domain-containing protein [Bacteroidota bacterium]